MPPGGGAPGPYCAAAALAQTNPGRYAEYQGYVPVVTGDPSGDYPGCEVKPRLVGTGEVYTGFNSDILWCVKCPPPTELPPGIPFASTVVDRDAAGRPISVMVFIPRLEEGQTASGSVNLEFGSTLTTLGITAAETIENGRIILTAAAADEEPLAGAIRFGDVVVGAWDADHNLEGKVAVAVFQFRLDEGRLAELGVDPSRIRVVRTADGQHEVRAPAVTDGTYTVAFPGLSLFSVVGTSPPLQCSICEVGEWGDCIDNKQSRLGNICNEQTGYTCRPTVETRLCAVPAPPAGLPLETLIPAVIVIAVGAVLLIRSRRRKF